MSRDRDSRPSDPAGTRPKVDPESLRTPEPPRDLPWAERDHRAQRGLEDSIERLEEVHVEQEDGASAHIGRFQFILGGLIAVGIIAVTAIVLVIIAGRTDGPDTDWSAWRPSGDDALQQIADHVGSTYRLAGGAQIVAVAGGPLKVGSDPQVSAQVLREDTNTKQLELQDGKTALFTMCGTGKDCAIAGQPTLERALYVRREALELALYAMHYTDADQVVVQIPPSAAGTALQRAVFLRRDDVGPELSQPLRDTLSSPPPPIGAIGRSPGIGLVDHLTSMYAAQLSQAANMNVYLVLSSLADAAAALSSSQTTTGTTTTTTPQATATPHATKKPRQKANGKSGG